MDWGRIDSYAGYYDGAVYVFGGQGVYSDENSLQQTAWKLDLSKLEFHASDPTNHVLGCPTSGDKTSQGVSRPRRASENERREDANIGACWEQLASAPNRRMSAPPRPAAPRRASTRGGPVARGRGGGRARSAAPRGPR